MSAIDGAQVDRALEEQLPLVAELALTDAQGGPVCALADRHRSTGMSIRFPACVRALCLPLPEATERISHGEPTWFVGQEDIRDVRQSTPRRPRGFWCAAPPGAQEALVGNDPEHFFRPPYVGHRGWLGVYLDVPVDWNQVAEIVVDAYRMVAPKKLLAELDQRLP